MDGVFFPSNPFRRDLVWEIDKGIKSIDPDQLTGERALFFETILEWLQRWLDQERNWSDGLDTHECSDPIRYLITLENESSYVISIHDPMQGGVGGAESVTGADYTVQFPTVNGRENFIFVQAKRDDYPVKPKQYFAFGGLYMFLQYVINNNWWRTRFSQEGDYVTKRGEPHGEPFFVSVYFDDEDVYIPLSSVLRTFEKSMYGIKNDLDSKERVWIEKHTGKFAEFSDNDQHLAPYFRSFHAFYRAAELGMIGMVHASEISITDRKMEGVMYMAEVLMRPNVNIIQVDPQNLESYIDVLT